MLRGVVDEVAAAAGPAISRLTAGIRLPATIHVVVIDDVVPGANAETVNRTDGADDCAIVLYGMAPQTPGAMARTLVHELFHCAQYSTWPAKMARLDGRWWSEGAAEWFEDFALPGRVADSDLLEALRVFRARSQTHSLLEGTYSNAVLFAWLGASRVVFFQNAMAEGGETQLAGAARALSGAEWQRFAQDYVDERVTMPSGMRVAGNEFGPFVPTVHTTTGTPGSDPVFEPRETVPPLVLYRGKIDFTPAEYAPTGQFGPLRTVFSERVGSWGQIPNPLRSDCEGRKQIRFAALSTGEGRLRVDPGTRRRADGRCACPVGVWTIRPEDLMSLSPTPQHRFGGSGDMRMQFNADGTAVYEARNLRFISPSYRQGSLSFQVTIERSYEASFTWSAEGEFIVMNAVRPLRTVERITHVTSMGTSTRPPRISELESDNYAGRRKMFKCTGNELTITPPVERVSRSRIWVDRDRELRYPFYGVFVKQ